MSPNDMVWHATSASSKHGVGDNNAIVTCAGVIVEACKVDFAESTKIGRELGQHDCIHGGVAWNRSMLAGVEEIHDR